MRLLILLSVIAALLGGCEAVTPALKCATIASRNCN